MRAVAYAEHAASIVATMGRYAVAGNRRGLANGLRAFQALAREVKSAALRADDAHDCPICGWSGPRFGPVYYIDHYREDVRCFGCGSTDRSRVAKLYVERYLGDFFAARRRRVLDIGPLRISRGFFPADVDYVSFDLFSPLAMVKGDLARAPFEDAYCDLWICFHVLDVIPDDEAAMRELFRTLRPGGVGLLDNAMSWDRPTEEYAAARPEECHHRRRYGHDLPDRLRRVGFDVEIADIADLFDAETLRRHSLHMRKLLLCRRPENG